MNSGFVGSFIRLIFRLMVKLVRPSRTRCLPFIITIVAVMVIFFAIFFAALNSKYKSGVKSGVNTFLIAEKSGWRFALRQYGVENIIKSSDLPDLYLVSFVRSGCDKCLEQATAMNDFSKNGIHTIALVDGDGLLTTSELDVYKLNYSEILHLNSSLLPAFWLSRFEAPYSVLVEKSRIIAIIPLALNKTSVGELIHSAKLVHENIN